MAIDFDALMTRAGKMMKAAEVLDTARATTVPDEVEDVTDQFGTASMELRQSVALLPQATAAWQAGGESLQAALRDAFAQLLRQTVEEDNPQESARLDDLVAEFIAQMQGSETVDASAVGASISAAGAPAGNGVFALSTLRGDGRVQELAAAEDVSVTVVAEEPASLRFRGEAAESKLSHRWPAGSGVDRTIAAVGVAVAAGNLLKSGAFETDDAVAAGAPADWVVAVGQIGTTLTLTSVEEQTVAIAGDPTGGHYRLHWTDAAGNQQSTSPIAYDAGGAAVEAALRTLSGLEQVTVTSTGTSPNWTHTVAMHGVANPAQLTSTALLAGGGAVNEVQEVSITGGTPGSGNFTLNFDGEMTASIAYDASAAAVESALEALSNIDDVTATGGPLPGTAVSVEFDGAPLAATNLPEMTAADVDLDAGTPAVATTTQGSADETIAHATPVAGSPHVFTGARALEIVGNGSENTTLAQRLVGLAGRSSYAFCVWIKVDDSAGDFPVAGELTVDLVDGLDSPNVIDDDAGVANSRTVDLTTDTELVADEYAAVPAVFRTPRVVPEVVYLRVRLSTAASATASIYLDHMILASMTELYSGGPLVTAFSGSAPWRRDDQYVLTVTNDRAGTIHEFFNRWLDLDRRGLLLPTDSPGSLPDATYIT